MKKANKKDNSKKIAISKKTFVSLVNENLKGKDLFKDKIDHAKKLLKGNKNFTSLNAK